MDEAVQRYLDAIPPEQKPLFERLQSLILQLYPDAEIVISYQIPVQGESRTRLLGLWKNGVSLYTTDPQYIKGFASQHPTIKAGKASLNFKLTDELRDGSSGSDQAGDRAPVSLVGNHYLHPVGIMAAVSSTGTAPMRVEESVEINRPLQEVFNYVSDVNSYPEWMAHVLGYARTHPAQPQQGDRFTSPPVRCARSRAGRRSADRGHPRQLVAGKVR